MRQFNIFSFKDVLFSLFLLPLVKSTHLMKRLKTHTNTNSSTLYFVRSRFFPSFASFFSVIIIPLTLARQFFFFFFFFASPCVSLLRDHFTFIQFYVLHRPHFMHSTSYRHNTFHDGGGGGIGPLFNSHHGFNLIFSSSFSTFFAGFFRSLLKRAYCEHIKIKAEKFDDEQWNGHWGRQMARKKNVKKWN